LAENSSRKENNHCCHEEMHQLLQPETFKQGLYIRQKLLQVRRKTPTDTLQQKDYKIRRQRTKDHDDWQLSSCHSSMQQCFLRGDLKDSNCMVDRPRWEGDEDNSVC
jgi:hypothetical protein